MEFETFFNLILLIGIVFKAPLPSLGTVQKRNDTSEVLTCYSTDNGSLQTCGSADDINTTTAVPHTNTGPHTTTATVLNMTTTVPHTSHKPKDVPHYCFTVIQKSGSQSGEEGSSIGYEYHYGCATEEAYDTQKLCEKYPLSEYFQVPGRDMELNISCCNTSKCNKPIVAYKKEPEASITCYSVKESKIKKKHCASDATHCLTAFPTESSAGMTKIADHSYDCDQDICSKHIKESTNKSDKCFLNKQKICLCCCNTSLCNNITKIPKECSGVIPTGKQDGSTNQPHKPDGTTSTPVVVSSVIAGVLVLCIIAIVLVVYFRVRKRKGDGAILNYRRVDAGHIDDGEDVRMLLTT